MLDKKFENKVLENLNDIYSYILSPKEIFSLKSKIIKLLDKKEFKKKIYCHRMIFY